MGNLTPVCVYAPDPILEAGMVASLRSRPQLVPCDQPERSETVAVVVAGSIDDDVVRDIRRARREGCCAVVLVVSSIQEGPLFAAIEAGATNIVPRIEADPARLEGEIAAAAEGQGSLPPELLGRLMQQVAGLHDSVLASQGLNLSGLNDREIDVLKLLADGYTTAEIAEELAYSERTVKGVLQDLRMRLNLRNRTHAVAYALRLGLI